MGQVFMHNFPKLTQLFEQLTQRLEQEYPRILDHLRQNSLGVESAFISFFMTFSVDKVPVEISSRLIEVFLLYGDSGYMNMIVRMIDAQQNQIYALRDEHL